MNTSTKRNTYYKILLPFIFLFISNFTHSQEQQLVWADEFDEASINRSIWSFNFGTANDNVHYFTDREENAKIENGILQIIAQKESYQGFNYTAALLKTAKAISWRYGRIEASIKLPSSNGFVPAFWMLPEDDFYGWWPSGGEIDILEHPTNQVDKIYGTVHTGKYNSFTGSDNPQGSNITISDAESTFHLYAIEWTEDQIDFYVDDQKYFTFTNEKTGYEAWPFDQPFYIILSMGVGGGWVGDPDASSIFPSIMEVDFVRVYQNLNDISISGPDFLPKNYKASAYSLPIIENASYSWFVSGGAKIVSGQNTNNIIVDWDIFSGNVGAEIISDLNKYAYNYSVNVSNNFIKNNGFEKGAKYWNKARPYPGDIEFSLVSNDVHSGNNSLLVDVKTSSTNPWDVQLSQSELSLISGKQYITNFWAKTNIDGSKINAAIINSSTYAQYSVKSFTLNNTWTKYELNFTAPVNAIAQFNIDMGGGTGNFYFDDFTLALPEISSTNQILNSEFSDGNSNWIFNTFAPAQAIGEVKNGEFSISISNGGTNLWDIHLGQENINIEKGKEYLVSFDAYAAEPRDISALVGKNSDPWNVYSGSQTFTLTTSKKTYSYTFIMNDATDNKARIGFDIGKSSTNLFFDNIFLSKGEIPVNVVSENTSDINNYEIAQNYPNPFNPNTKIKYTIPNFSKGKNLSSSYVEIKVYDIIGNEITTLINQNQLPGNYEIEFDARNLPSGIYFYRMKADNFINSKKMILLK